jgi:hypothetical protein
MALAILITIVDVVLCALELSKIGGITLWLGGMLGWMFVFGDNIDSFHDVLGIIALISVVTNGILGLVFGAIVGGVIRILRPQYRVNEDNIEHANPMGRPKGRP